MGRYYKAPENEIVDITPKIPVEFFSNLINKAAENRDKSYQSAAMYVDDLTGQEYRDKETRDKVINRAKEELNKSLDLTFPDLANIANAMVNANRYVNKWKLLNKKHVEGVKEEENLKRQWGAYYRGNSVADKKLMKDNGEFVDPEELDLIAANADTYFKLLQEQYKEQLNRIREKSLGLTPVEGGKFYKYGTKTLKGLTLEEAQAEADKMANEGFSTLLSPADPYVRAVAASLGITNPTKEDLKQGPLYNYLHKELSQWTTTNLVRGEELRENYLANPGWSSGSGLTIIPKDALLSTREHKPYGKEDIAGLDKNTAGKYNTIYNLVENWINNTDKDAGKKLMAYPEFKKLYSQYMYLDKNKRPVLDIDGLKQAAKETFGAALGKFSTQVDFKDKEASTGMVNMVLNNNNLPRLIGFNINGISSNVTSKLNASNIKGVSISTNGNLLITYDKKNSTGSELSDVIEINAFDEYGNPTGAYDNETLPLAKMLYKIHTEKYKVADKKDPTLIGTVSNIPYIDKDNNVYKDILLNAKYSIYSDRGRYFGLVEYVDGDGNVVNSYSKPLEQVQHDLILGIGEISKAHNLNK